MPTLLREGPYRFYLGIIYLCTPSKDHEEQPHRDSTGKGAGHRDPDQDEPAAKVEATHVYSSLRWTVRPDSCS